MRWEMGTGRVYVYKRPLSLFSLARSQWKMSKIEIQETALKECSLKIQNPNFHKKWLARVERVEDGCLQGIGIKDEAITTTL